MKIVYIDDFFHPDAGYQDNILTKYWASFGHKVYMLTAEMEKIPESLTKFFGKDDIDSKDKKFQESYHVRIVRLPLIAYISGRAVFTNKIFRVIKKINPDIIFVNGNDSLIGIQMTCRARNLKAKLVLDSHMLEMASTNKFRKLFRFYYKSFITPIIEHEHIPIIRTQDDDYVERCLGVPLNMCPYISFGTDLTRFHPDANNKLKMREKLGISKETFVILYAGKLDKVKGADLLADVTQQRLETNKKVCFLIIGNTSGDYGAEIEEKFKNSSNTVLRLPTQKYDDLASYYQCADIAVFPKQCSLSFFDVQGVGLPVVFEDNNINIDRASHGNAKTFISDSLQDFTVKITEFINMDSSELKQTGEKAISYIKENYDYSDRAKEYIEIFNKQLNI